MRGDSADTSVRGLESEEGVYESLDDHVALIIDVLLLFFIFWGYFKLSLVYLEK
jgi:hypothetical protein